MDQATATTVDNIAYQNWLARNPASKVTLVISPSVLARLADKGAICAHAHN
jgi:hypothetical protein